MAGKEKIEEIKKEQSAGFHRITSQSSDGTIGVSDRRTKDSEAIKESRERVGKIQNESYGPKLQAHPPCFNSERMGLYFDRMALLQYLRRMRH